MCMLIPNACRFQYVTCQFDALQQHRSKAKIQEALRDLPKGLDATYDKILKNINPEYQKQVASILKWLAFSLRPLLVEELAEAFILDHQKPIVFDENERLFNADEIFTYLPGLVVRIPVNTSKVNMESETRRNILTFQVQFVHFSIKEYLCSTGMTSKYFSTAEQISNLHISESCLA
jgi:hypothetical protein